MGVFEIRSKNSVGENQCSVSMSSRLNINENAGIMQLQKDVPSKIYLDLGIHLHFFPLHTLTRPRLSEWMERATNDHIQLETWESEYPGCAWGLVLGPKSGICVLNVIDKNDETYLQNMQSDGYAIPETLTVKTQKGHYLCFHWPKDMPWRKRLITPTPSWNFQLDGYVVFPPAVYTPEAGCNYIDPYTPIATAPEWMIDKCLVCSDKGYENILSSAKLPPQRAQMTKAVRRVA